MTPEERYQAGFAAIRNALYAAKELCEHIISDADLPERYRHEADLVLQIVRTVLFPKE